MSRRTRIGAWAAMLAFLSAGLPSALVPSRAQQAPPAQPQQPVQSGSQERPAFTARAELVDVVFAVFNRRLKFITDLQKENFKIFEDNQPQEIRFFSRETDLPLRVGMLLDTSNSIRDRLKFEQEAAIDFLYNVMRRRKDMAFLMTFDNEPEVIQDYTEDLGQLRDAILKQRAGGGTALYDALYAACERLQANPPASEGSSLQVRRVLVVISDGDDNLSSRTRSEAIEMARRVGVVIYAISTSTQWVTASEEHDTSKRTERKYHKDEGDKVLDSLTEETGGRSFFPYRADDLSQSFLDIGDELRSQYSLAYIPSNKAADGKFRKIRLEVDRKGLQVRARKGYYAPRASADASSPPGAPAARPSSKPPGL